MILRFKNWDKYNKRQKDIKRPYWFAMSNEIFTDAFYVDLSDQERQAFLWLLCEASKQNKYGEFEVSERLFCQITGYKKQVLLSVTDKLLKSGRAAGSRQDGGGNATATEQNRTEHNSTEQNTFASSDEKSLSHPKAYESVVDVFDQRGVKPSTTSLWETAYPDCQWVVQEIRKALAWEGANAKRKKRDFARFMTNWLNNGWDRRRIDAPRQQTTKGFRPSTERTNDLDLEIFGDKK